MANDVTGDRDDNVDLMRDLPDSELENLEHDISDADAPENNAGNQ